MKRKPAIVAVVVLALGLAAAYVWRGPSQPAGGALQLHGNVDIREVELAFRQGGRVARVAVDEGAAVKAGELLAELDARPLEDALLAAQAARAMAAAELDKLRRGNRRQEVAQSHEAVRQAEAAAAEAERQQARQAALFADGMVSAQAVEAARSQREQTQALLASARQGLSLRQEGARREDIAAAEARLAGVEAQLALARTALADARLVAPSDGVVSTRLREAGSMVAAGAPVLTLALQEPVYVRAYASQPQLTRVRPGAVVTVTTDGSSQAFKGTVGSVSPRAEFTPKAVETAELRSDLVSRVRIVLPGAAHALRQGMPVTVLLDEGTPQR